MKIILFSRAQIAHTPEEIRQLFEAIDASGFDYAVNEEFAPVVRQTAGIALPPEKVYGRHIGEQPAGTIMVCYGGDGTPLAALHRGRFRRTARLDAGAQRIHRAAPRRRNDFGRNLR